MCPRNAPSFYLEFLTVVMHPAMICYECRQYTTFIQPETHTPMIPFGQTVLVWRLHRGLTQQGLAVKARVPRSNLSAIERGKQEVSLRTLRTLAMALDVRPGVLADGLVPGESGRQEAAWSRGRLERIADAVVHGAPLHDADERALAERLASVIEPRSLASAKHWRSSRLSQRRRNTAWLQINTAYPPEVIKSLLQRIADRQQAP